MRIDWVVLTGEPSLELGEQTFGVKLGEMVGRGFEVDQNM